MVLLAYKALQVVLLCLIATADSRRVRLKPSTVSTAAREQEEAQLSRQVLYYSAEPNPQQEEEETPPVVIAGRQSNYNRQLHQQPGTSSRIKSDSSPKTPPVQTLRNFNKLNDDGSFTFGYEAADGSFKEETRGIDCVVRGKYGYVDPDGNKREFTYVSGNPCDPNAISQEEEDELKDKSKEEEENIPRNIPQHIPRRPTFVLRQPPSIPQRPKQATTLFQQTYNNEEENEEQDNQLQLNVKQPLRQVYRNSLVQDEEELHSAPQPPQLYLRTSTARPKPRIAAYQSQATTRILARPATVDNQPATTYRPQVIQLPVTATPSSVLPPLQSPRPAYIATPSPTQSTYFDDQFKKFQLDDNVIPSEGGPSKPISNNPIYSTELVYDPSTGQYNTIVYQQVPKTNQKLQFVSTSQPPTIAQKQLFASTSTQTPVYQQQLIQQAQANQVQQSQQLYNLQLRQQQQQQRFLPPKGNFVKPIRHQSQQYPVPLVQQRYPPDQRHNFQQPFAAEGGYGLSTPQPFYYLNPSSTDERQTLATGQIEAFLRGHNLSF